MLFSQVRKYLLKAQKQCGILRIKIGYSIDDFTEIQIIEERMRALSTPTRMSGAEKVEERFEHLEKDVGDDTNSKDEEWKMDEEIDYVSDDDDD